MQLLDEVFKFWRAAFMVASMAIMLTFAGCASLGGGGLNPPANLQTAVQAVIAYCKQYCGYVPLADDVAAVVTASFPSLAIPANGLASVAHMICDAPVAKTAVRGRMKLVKTVVVNGRAIAVRSQ